MNKALQIKGYELSGKKPCICVPIVAKTASEVISAVKKCVEKQVKLIELRMDFFAQLKDEEALLALLEELSQICASTMLLFTIRTSNEGGQVEITEEEYLNILRLTSHSHHVDLIDCEIDMLTNPSDFIEELKNDGVYVIASHHNFNKTYNKNEILAIYERMLAAGADIQKIAMMPNDKHDVFEALDAANAFSESNEDSLVVAISMGDLGKLSRICGGYVGSCITFSSLEKASAPGQLSYDDMVEIIEKVNF